MRSIEPPVEEVNFWKPGSDLSFRALTPGEPLFFKLKAPRNVIGGFGYFAHYSVLPVSMAWQVYGIGNGAASLLELRARLLAIRARHDMEVDPKKDFRIGCILANRPVFFDDHDFVRVPADWSGNILQGKAMTSRRARGSGSGSNASLAARRRNMTSESPRRSSFPAATAHPSSSAPAYGQRSFRVAVLDSYDRRCAITGERTLPALDAAHIRQYADVQEHSVNNGILFRADIHWPGSFMTVSAAAPDTRLSASSDDDFAPQHSVDYAFVAKSPSSSHPDPSPAPRDETVMNDPGCSSTPATSPSTPITTFSSANESRKTSKTGAITTRSTGPRSGCRTSRATIRWPRRCGGTMRSGFWGRSNERYQAFQSG